MVGEIDACKVIPGDRSAYDEGRKIGEHALATGNVSGVYAELSQYTQKLFTALPKDVSAQERQRLWKAGQRDAMAGIACADPRDFQLTEVTSPGGVVDTKLTQKPDVATPVNAALGMLDRYNRDPKPDHAPLPGTTLDGTIQQVNAFIHNRVEPLGPGALKAFVEDFNKRRGGALDIQDVDLKAELVDDGKRAIIRKEVH